MTPRLYRATTLAISSHAASVATAALITLPGRKPARWVQWAQRADEEATKRWRMLGKELRRK